MIIVDDRKGVPIPWTGLVDSHNMQECEKDVLIDCLPSYCEKHCCGRFVVLSVQMEPFQISNREVSILLLKHIFLFRTHAYLLVQDGMNSVQLAVVAGHIDLVRDLVDNFKASIDFSTSVRVHVYMGIRIYVLHPLCTQVLTVYHRQL